MKLRRLNMKEIKFRAKIKPHRMVPPPDDFEQSWVYGSYVDRSGQGYVYDFIIDAEGEKHAVIRKTVGQFVGLTDNSGTEIYEGDVVETYINYGPAGDTKSTIKAKISPWGCNIQKWVVEQALLLEVIGNIHENPELV